MYLDGRPQRFRTDTSQLINHCSPLQNWSLNAVCLISYYRWLYERFNILSAETSRLWSVLFPWILLHARGTKSCLLGDLMGGGNEVRQGGDREGQPSESLCIEDNWTVVGSMEEEKVDSKRRELQLRLKGEGGFLTLSCIWFRDKDSRFFFSKGNEGSVVKVTRQLRTVVCELFFMFYGHGRYLNNMKKKGKNNALFFFHCRSGFRFCHGE